jgi:hypothetical protein
LGVGLDLQQLRLVFYITTSHNSMFEQANHLNEGREESETVRCGLEGSVLLSDQDLVGLQRLL